MRNMVDLKELRKKAGLTQEQLAEKVYVSVNTIQNWENKKTAPKGDNINKYLDALRIRNKDERNEIIAELNSVTYVDESDMIDNIPYFLFSEDSEQLDKIRECYATAEELDMLGYAYYVSGRKYSNARNGVNWPLDFAFFEKYGGFNTTRKKMADVHNRLGKLYEDAIFFAEKNPGVEYRLSSLGVDLIVEKIGMFIGNESLMENVRELYNSLKAIENTDTNQKVRNAGFVMNNIKELNYILKRYEESSFDKSTLGRYEGYIELEKDMPGERLTVSMLKLTERGKELIKWFEENKN